MRESWEQRVGWALRVSNPRLPPCKHSSPEGCAHRTTGQGRDSPASDVGIVIDSALQPDLSQAAWVSDADADAVAHLVEWISPSLRPDDEDDAARRDGYAVTP